LKDFSVQGFFKLCYVDSTLQFGITVFPQLEYSPQIERALCNQPYERHTFYISQNS